MCERVCKGGGGGGGYNALHFLSSSHMILYAAITEAINIE